jgi:hypothetical protein
MGGCLLSGCNKSRIQSHVSCTHLLLKRGCITSVHQRFASVETDGSAIQWLASGIVIHYDKPSWVSLSMGKALASVFPTLSYHVLLPFHFPKLLHLAMLPPASTCVRCRGLLVSVNDILRVKNAIYNESWRAFFATVRSFVLAWKTLLLRRRSIWT